MASIIDLGRRGWHSAVMQKFLVLLLCLPAFAQDGEWTQLFNGKNLDGWTPKIRYHELGDNAKNTFRVEDGLLTVGYEDYDEFNESFGHLFYDTPYSNYVLRIEYRFIGEQCKGGPGWAFRNSGAMLHGQDPKTMKKDQDFPNSIEVQFLGGKDDGKPRTTCNTCTPGTHMVMGGKLIKAHCKNSSSKTYHGQQWVTCEIEARADGKMIYRIEGQKVFELDDPQLDDGTKLRGGTISLQSESHPVQFRKVEIKQLP